MATSKKLINSPSAAVVDMLEGIAHASGPHIQLLDGLPDVKVVINAAHDKSQVAVISGGGSGHEPAHAGYVGPGMLAAAVCGDVFASPSSDAVLAAILAVTGPGGCLLVVKNYTGDRLHFGIAAEQAKAAGLAVEMVVVAEDVAIERPGLAGARGLAGTVFVHKAAGAAAAAGMPLPQVAALAARVAGSMATLGVALSVCTLPGQPPSDRLGANEIELGLGIHGEPGTRKVPLMPADELVATMLDSIASSAAGSSGMRSRCLAAGAPVALMVNNLGGTPPMEMSIVTNAAVRLLRDKYAVHLQRLYVGPFMTSLDMAGCSLTLLALGEQPSELLQLLDAPASASGWPSNTTHEFIANKPRAPLPAGFRDATSAASTSGRPPQLSDEGQQLERCITAACSALIEAAAQLNEWDAKVGDGDCGSTVKRAAEAILADCVASYPLNDAAATLAALAHTVHRTVGGTSGALYDIGLTAAARENKGGAGGWTASLAAATKAIQLYGKADRGDRTMLDALLPAQAALAAAVRSGSGGKEAAAKAAAAAEEGASATAGMAATAGRASYVPEAALRSVPDPGAKAAAIWLRAVADAL